MNENPIKTKLLALAEEIAARIPAVCNGPDDVVCYNALIEATSVIREATLKYPDKEDWE